MKRVAYVAAGLTPLAFGVAVLPTAAANAGSGRLTSDTSARAKTVSTIHLAPNTACTGTSYTSSHRMFSSNMEFYFTSHYGGNANKVCIGTVYYQEYSTLGTGIDMRLRIRSKGNAILYSAHVGGTIHSHSNTYGDQVRQVFSPAPIEVCAAAVYGPHWSHIGNGPACTFIN
jgi:hypothetical protein